MFAALANQFADFAGFEVSQVYYLFTVTVCYPLAALHRSLPSAWLRHISAIVGGIWVLYMIIGPYQLLHPIISAVLGFAILNVAPRKNVHWVMMVFAFSYLSAGHIWRMYVDYLGWSVDFTAPQMMVTIKLIQLAWNYRDGMEDDEKLRPRQLKYRLKEVPQLVEILSYIMFFPCVYAGPTCEFADYINYTNAAGLWDANHKHAKYNSWGNALQSALMRYLETILVGVIYVVSTSYLPLEYMSSPQFIDRSIFVKYFYVAVAIAGSRHKYYLAWFVAEGAVMLSGLGFNGVDEETGKARFDGVLSCNYFKVEYARNYKMAIDNWNMQTQTWLKYYVYVRVPVSRPVAQLITWLLSALWHGFYPGYFFTFFLGAVATIGSQAVRRIVRPMFLDVSVSPPKPKHGAGVMFMYEAFSVLLAVQLSLNYFAFPFLTLVLPPAFVMWRATYYIPIIVVSLCAVYELAVPRKKTKKVE